jgi:hypothetical protein
MKIRLKYAKINREDRISMELNIGGLLKEIKDICGWLKKERKRKTP